MTHRRTYRTIKVMQKVILLFAVAFLMGMMGVSAVYAQTPTPTTSADTTPGAGSGAEVLEYCGYEKEDGTFFCDRASTSMTNCSRSEVCSHWSSLISGFQCDRKEESDCTFVPGTPKDYVEPALSTLCVYANSAHPDKVSCLQTNESMRAQPDQCPGVCSSLGLTCSSEKKKPAECQYLGLPPQDLGRSISLLYTWSLRVLGLVVFAMFTWAGVLRFFGGAAPGNIQKSKDIMTNAIYGAVLLLAAVIILNTINPDLTRGNIKIPSIENAPGTSGTGDGASIPTPTTTFQGGGGRSGGGGASGTF